MKETTIRKRNHVETKIVSPWLTPEEAALYLGLSLRKFEADIANRCPHAMLGQRIRRYHTEELDKLKEQPAADAPL